MVERKRKRPTQSGSSGSSSSQSQVRRSRKRLKTDLSVAWGRFRRLQDPFGKGRFGKFWYSSNLIREQESDDVYRTFVIIRYTLEDDDPMSYGYQLFYRSSGHNTIASDMWYPCDGFFIQQESAPIQRERRQQSQRVPQRSIVTSVYKKLFDTKFSRSMKDRADLIRAIQSIGHPRLTTKDDILESLLVRFGCRRFLYASYLLGGGIWDCIPGQQGRQHYTTLCGILGQSFEFEATPFPRPFQSSLRHVPVFSSDVDVNLFTKFAVSKNFLKDEYVDHERTEQWIDLSKWVRDKEVSIGNQSPLRKTMERITRKPFECLRTMTVLIEDTRYVPIDFYILNLDKMNCDFFDNLKNRYKQMVGKGDVRL